MRFLHHVDSMWHEIIRDNKLSKISEHVLYTSGALMADWIVKNALIFNRNAWSFLQDQSRLAKVCDYIKTAKWLKVIDAYVLNVIKCGMRHTKSSNGISRPKSIRVYCTNAANEVQIEIYWTNHKADVRLDRMTVAVAVGALPCFMHCGWQTIFIFNIIIRLSVNQQRHTPSTRLCFALARSLSHFQLDCLMMMTADDIQVCPFEKRK